MSVEYKDYYKILGVGREASKDEIAKAFKSSPASTTRISTPETRNPRKSSRK